MEVHMAEKKQLTIHERKFAVMEDMEGNPIAKDQKKGMQYMTLSHDKVTAAIRPLLIIHRIIPYASVIDHGRDGNLTWASVDVLFQNVDDKDDHPVLIRSFGYGVDAQDKGPGKAISYAVKYAYLKAFCLETTDDPENDSIARQSKPKPAANQPPDLTPDDGFDDYDQVGKSPTPPTQDNYCIPGKAACPLCNAKSLNIRPKKYGPAYTCDSCDKILKKAEWKDAGFPDPKDVYEDWLSHKGGK